MNFSSTKPLHKLEVLCQFIRKFRLFFCCLFILCIFIVHIQVFVKDLAKEYGGWPLNDMERSYKFMIKHVQLWKVAFHGTSPRWVHCFYLAALAAIYAK